jgi:hypothetical protein
MIERFLSTLESTKSFWQEVSQYLPSLLAAGVVLLVGWIVARIARKMAVMILRLLRVDVLAEKVGIEDFLLQGSVRYTTVTLLASIVYWLIMFTVILAALNSLGMQSAASLFNRVLLFIPNVIVAVLVLMFGAFFARIVRSISFTYLSNIGISGADTIGHIAQWAILLFALSISDPLTHCQLSSQILATTGKNHLSCMKSPENRGYTVRSYVQRSKVEEGNTGVWSFLRISQYSATTGTVPAWGSATIGAQCKTGPPSNSRHRFYKHILPLIPLKAYAI